MFKYFDELDEILGEKPQFNPPFVLHSDLASVLELSAGSEPLIVTNDPVDLADESACEITIVQTEPAKPTTSKKIKLSSSPAASTILKKYRRTPVKNASNALESAMKARVAAEEKRLAWERECHSEEIREKREMKEAEIKIQTDKLDFEKQKWNHEIEQTRISEDRKFELEKLKIDREAEIAKFKIEQEFEIEKLKIQNKFSGQ